MPLNAQDAKRADALETLAARRPLTQQELVEYNQLAQSSYQRSVLAKPLNHKGQN